MVFVKYSTSFETSINYDGMGVLEGDFLSAASIMRAISHMHAEGKKR